MKAEILSVGTELLLGQIVDTNANYLAQQLPALGLDLFFVTQVGDNLERLASTLRSALERSDVVITSGGIGPTEDDLTREAVALVLGEEMRVQPDLEVALRAHFRRRGREMPERNVKQAATIASGTYLPNPIGTAPGWWVETHDKYIICMPGVPHEMRRMWEEQAAPRLAEHIVGGAIVSRVLKLIGLGESWAEEALGDLTHSLNPTLATYAKPDGVHLRITAKAITRSAADALLDAFEPRIRARVGEYVYGYENDTLPAVLGSLLRDHRLTLASAESATGGQVAALVTDAPGASDYFLGGAIVYSRSAKEALGVSPHLLSQQGTVSEETSRALASAVRARYAADVGVATTGVAGLHAVDGVPPGTLFTAVDVRGAVSSEQSHYRTGRTEFKRRGSLEALNLVWRTLREAPPDD